MCEYRSSSPVILLAATSSSSSCAPLASSVGWYFSPFVSFCSRLTFVTNPSPNVPSPASFLSWNRPFSMRWNPFHWAAGTSPARASMSASRLSAPTVNDSATGSIFS